MRGDRYQLGDTLIIKLVFTVTCSGNDETGTDIDNAGNQRKTSSYIVNLSFLKVLFFPEIY